MCVCGFFCVCSKCVCVRECFAFEWILKSPSVFHYHSAQTQLVFHRQLSHLPRVCVCVCVQTHYWRLQIKKKRERERKRKKDDGCFHEAQTVPLSCIAALEGFVTLLASG